jgi:hypothetical protein
MSDAALHILLAEYYKMGLNAQTNCAMFNQPIPNIASLFGGSLPSLKGASSPSSSPSAGLLKGMPGVSITPTGESSVHFLEEILLKSGFSFSQQAEEAGKRKTDAFDEQVSYG